MPTNAASYGGAGLFGPSPSSADPIGMSEPNVVPGGVGDVDSILRQIQSGQFSAEALLPLLMMLAQAPMGGQIPPQLGPQGPQPQGGVDPIEQAFLEGEQGQPQPGQQQQLPPDLMAMLGGL